MFTKLYENMIEMTDDQKNQYNNLYRWYRHIQNLPEIKEFLNKHQRLLVEDPEIKVPFLAEKKKGKKWSIDVVFDSFSKSFSFISIKFLLSQLNFNWRNTLLIP